MGVVRDRTDPDTPADFAGDTEDGEVPGATLKTDAELQDPVGYTDIYGSSWNIDVDDDTGTGDASGNDDPWDFGSDSEYPILKFANLDTRFDQRADKFPHLRHGVRPSPGVERGHHADADAANRHRRRRND